MLEFPNVAPLDSVKVADVEGPGLTVFLGKRQLFAAVFHSRDARDTAMVKLKEAFALTTAVEGS